MAWLVRYLAGAAHDHGMRIGFDIDGVLYDFRGSQSAFELARGNTHCSVDRCTPHWNYYEGWGWTFEQWLAAYIEAVDAGHLLWVGEALPGATTVTGRCLEAGHEVHIVTDRSIGADPQGATRHWLSDPIPGSGLAIPYTSLTFSSDKTVVPTDWFIDDKTANVVALHAAGTRAVLMDRPWNQDAPAEIPRVHHLDEFVDMVLAADPDLAA